MKNNSYRVCFTPGGRCTQLIVSTITQATKSINVQAYSFTSKPIAKALIQAKQRGVKVVAILDKSNTHEKYSQMGALSQAGIPVYIDSKVRIAHNKVIILDGGTTITGSFNFSWSAQHRNAENVLIVVSKSLARRYLQNFHRRLKVSVPYNHYCVVSAKHHCRAPVLKAWKSVLPPAYLSIPHWQQCVKTEKRHAAEFYCLTRQRRYDCPAKSWKMLTADHLMSYCQEK